MKYVNLICPKIFVFHLFYSEFHLNDLIAFIKTLKLQSVSFASLSPSPFENLELQLLAELSQP